MAGGGRARARTSVASFCDAKPPAVRHMLDNEHLQAFCARHPTLLRYEGNGAGKAELFVVNISCRPAPPPQSDAKLVGFKSSDLAGALRRFVVEHGGRVKGSGLAHFYVDHPDARPIFRGGLKRFCDHHPQLLRFEADDSAGHLIAVGLRPNEAPQAEPPKGGNELQTEIGRVALEWKDYLAAPGNHHLIGASKEVLKDAYALFAAEHGVRKNRTGMGLPPIMSRLRKLGYEAYGTWLGGEANTSGGGGEAAGGGSSGSAKVAGTARGAGAGRGAAVERRDPWTESDPWTRSATTTVQSWAAPPTALAATAPAVAQVAVPASLTPAVATQPASSGGAAVARLSPPATLPSLEEFGLEGFNMVPMVPAPTTSGTPWKAAALPAAAEASQGAALAAVAVAAGSAVAPPDDGGVATAAEATAAAVREVLGSSDDLTASAEGMIAEIVKVMQASLQGTRSARRRVVETRAEAVAASARRRAVEGVTGADAEARLAKEHALIVSRETEVTRREANVTMRESLLASLFTIGRTVLAVPERAQERGPKPPIEWKCID
eukprot:NODE_148_length_1953_cov_2.511064.p1 GENE.NODE_148_length_1953_cov_2.511064~~NODE_148_length_1953_cov_2.511064.p1  ORF type:complete len:637 (+),score=155.39 NODE_148_length_1953_cov_2.511064:264-1913(+)